jgi:hypothetical protein
MDFKYRDNTDGSKTFELTISPMDYEGIDYTPQIQESEIAAMNSADISLQLVHLANVVKLIEDSRKE